MNAKNGATKSINEVRIKNDTNMETGFFFNILIIKRINQFPRGFKVSSNTAIRFSYTYWLTHIVLNIYIAV